MDEPTDDVSFALRAVPAAKELMAIIKAKLPEGAHFGLMLLDGTDPNARLLAITTDRNIMAPPIARWACDVLEDMTRG